MWKFIFFQIRGWDLQRILQNHLLMLWWPMGVTNWIFLVEFMIYFSHKFAIVDKFYLSLNGTFYYLTLKMRIESNLFMSVTSKMWQFGYFSRIQITSKHAHIGQKYSKPCNFMLSRIEATLGEGGECDYDGDTPFFWRDLVTHGRLGYHLVYTLTKTSLCF